MARVSIIIPVYNVESVLKRCVESVLKQSYFDFELILVDDGSTDDSGKVCDEFAENDARVKVIHQNNSGVSKSRNVGLDQAKGEFICFIDSDDFVETKYLETLLLKEEDLSICSCMFYEDKTKQRSIARLERSHYGIVNNITIGEWFDHGSLYSVWAAMFRRKIIDDSCLRFNTNTSRGEDTIFMLEYVCKCKKVRFCEERLYNYVRYGKGTLTTNDRPSNINNLIYLDCYLKDYFMKYSINSEKYIMTSFWTRSEVIVQIINVLMSNHFSCREKYIIFKSLYSSQNYKGYEERLLLGAPKRFGTIVRLHSPFILLLYSFYLRLRHFIRKKEL